ncbi:MAG: hypothetical protein WBL63_04575, partial [Candidatus Acidiferrum sp.]
MKKLFLAASLIFGSIPGISIMTSGLGTPPGYATIFGGVIQAFGALCILLLVASKEKLRGLSGRKITLAAIGLASASLCFLVLYIQLLSLCVVTHPLHGSVYFPLWNSGPALEMVSRAGGRYAAIDRYGSYPVSKAIQEAPNYPLPMVTTTVLLLFVYQGIFTTLTLAFGIIGVHSGAGLDAEGAVPVESG